MKELIERLPSTAGMGLVCAALLEGRDPRETFLSALDDGELNEFDLDAMATLLIEQAPQVAVAGTLAAALLEWLSQSDRLLIAAVRGGMRFVAVEPASPVRSAILAYLETIGRRSEQYEKLLKQEASEANYATRSAKSAELPRDPLPARDWESWEEDGWGSFERDWGIAKLLFALPTSEALCRLLRTVRSPLIPVRHRVQYFLLHRLWRAKETSFELVSALGQLARITAKNPELAELHDRAVLVFRNHWRLLPMWELAEMAAEAYSDLSYLYPRFTQPARPDTLEGMDLDRLRVMWRGDAADLDAVEQQTRRVLVRWLP
jgi:hypothetical protein